MDLPDVSTAESLDSALFAPLRVHVPGYRLVGILGRGGQATVYKALGVSDGTLVAIKILHGGPFADADARRRFDREIVALKALRHPNIVTHRASGRTPSGHQFLVMNFIDGVPLNCYLWPSEPSKAPDLSEQLRLFIKVCHAVGMAHRAGITHRDLSPSNICVDATGEPHILDFGLARTTFDGVLPGISGAVTATHQFVGKLAYASPEQVAGLKDVDIRSDVYTLGVLLYRILADDQFPYDVRGGMVATIDNILRQAPVPPPMIHGLPKGIEAVVLRALQKKPSDRHGTASELAIDLERCLDTTSSAAAPQWLHRAVALLAFAAGAASCVLCWRIAPAARPAAQKQILSAAELVPLRQSQRAYVTNGLGMKFISIAPATFQMGIPAGVPGRYAMELPPHRVTLTQSYLIEATHVTRGQFASFVRATGYLTDADRLGGGYERDWIRNKELPRDPTRSWRNPGFPQTDDHPVLEVSWNDAMAFAAWLSHVDGRNYSLPTEAQWEYAARGGTETAYFWGAHAADGRGFANIGEENGWNDGFEFTSPGGFFKPNPFGLYDTLGNAWEWCADFNSPPSAADAVDPLASQPPGVVAEHIVRGAAWHADSINLRVGARYGHLPDFANATQGFRLVSDARVSPAPGPVPAVTQTAQTGREFRRALNLLAGLDLTRDNRGPGAWTLRNGKVTSAANSGNQLEFPYACPPEYNLCVNFIPPVGVSHLMFFVPAGAHQINWDVGARDNTACSIDLIDNKDEGQNVTTRWADHWLVAGEPNTVVIQIRRHHFAGYLNGTLVCDYDTDFHDIGLRDWTHFTRPDTPGVMFYVPGVLIESIMLTEITGEGTLLRTIQGPPARPSRE